MSQKEYIKQFLNSLANDKYTEAETIFPKVMDSVIQNVINNNKPEVLKKLNAEAEKIATSAIELETASGNIKEPLKNETT